MKTSMQLIALLLCLSLALCLAACGAKPETPAPESQTPSDIAAPQQTEEPEETEDEGGSFVQIPNPFVDCESLEEAAKLAGFEITLAAEPDGYPERLIQAVQNDMIQVFFTDGDLAEEETASVLFRKAVGSEDISGDYNEYASVTEQDVNGRTVTLKGDGKLTYLAIWTDGEFSYSVSVSNGADTDAVLALVDGLH